MPAPLARSCGSACAAPGPRGRRARGRPGLRLRPGVDWWAAPPLPLEAAGHALLQDAAERGTRHGLCEQRGHPGGQASVDIVAEGAGGEPDDGDVVPRGLGPDGLRRGDAVHDRHLEVHEDHRVVVPLPQEVERVLPVVGDGDLREAGGGRGLGEPPGGPTTCSGGLACADPMDRDVLEGGEGGS